jgi:glycosyltransferase involved in cell wall biosynthesis
MHVVYSFRPEGVPRLALSLAHGAYRQQGVSSVFVGLNRDDTTLLKEAEACGVVEWVLWRSWRDVSVFMGMWKLLGKHTPKGVVCYALGPHLFVALACFLKGIPCVVHVGNTPPKKGFPRFKIGLFWHMAAPFVTAYVACSEYVKQQCIRGYRASSKKTVAVTNGVAVETWHALRANRTTGEEGFTVGMVASLEHHKDHPTLLKALRLLWDAGHRVRACFVGDGTRREELHALAEAYGVLHCIEWAGACKDVGAYLQKMDVFVYAVTDDEGWGIALVEALCAGVPVVASDVGACREVLQNGAWGVLCEASNAESLAKGILQARGAQPLPEEACAVFSVDRTWCLYAQHLGGVF